MYNTLINLVNAIISVQGVFVYGEYVRNFVFYSYDKDNATFGNKIDVFVKNQKAIEDFLTEVLYNGSEIVEIFNVNQYHNDPNYTTTFMHIKKDEEDFMIYLSMPEYEENEDFFINDFFIEEDALYLDCDRIFKLMPYYCYKNKLECFDETIQNIIQNIKMKKATIITHEAEYINMLMKSNWNCVFKNITPFMRAPGEQCILCMDDLCGFAVGCKRGCCNAHYHHKCFMKIAAASNKCPMCRAAF